MMSGYEPLVIERMGPVVWLPSRYFVFEITSTTKLHKLSKARLGKVR